MATTWDSTTLGSSETLSNGNLTVTASAATVSGARSVGAAISSGLYYWELTFTTITGADTGGGITLPEGVYANLGANGACGCEVFKSGNIYLHGTATGMSIGALSNGSLVGIALDLGNKRIWFRLGAAGNWNGSVSKNPTQPATGLDIEGICSSYLLAVATTNATSDSITANFGGSAFTGTVPTGYGNFPTTALPTFSYTEGGVTAVLLGAVESRTVVGSAGPLTYGGLMSRTGLASTRPTTGQMWPRGDGVPAAA